MRRLIALAASLLCLPAALPAQSHPLVGAWEIEMPVGAQVDNGVPTPIMGSGSLAVAVEGDSLVGLLDLQPPAGMPARPATRLATKLAPGPATFVHRSKAKVSINGEESERSATSTYVLEATGDIMAGTVERSLEGADLITMGGPQQVRGKRVKPAG